MAEKPTILICPLDWGIGHASRLIPIIENLLAGNNNIMIAGEGKSLELLKKTFPELKFIYLKGYNISYSKHLPVFIKTTIQIPKILKAIKTEKNALQQILKKYRIDMVISDNRFGLSTKDTKCIYITHQIMIKMPWFLKFMEYPVYKIHKKYIEKYDECWIPDIENKPNIAGDLTTKYPLPRNSKHIGLLSRFKEETKTAVNIVKNSVLVILSGPEPQRTIFEKILIKQISGTNLNAVIVRGMENQKLEVSGNITLHPHLNTENLKKLIIRAEYIICRSGYSTIMDLLKLKKNAILVPTPGQTEQEYLAKYYHNKGIFYTMSQKKFDLNKALSETKYLKKTIQTYSEFKTTLQHNHLSSK